MLNPPHTRYEKMILGQIRCQKAPQVVRVWVAFGYMWLYLVETGCVCCSAMFPLFPPSAFLWAFLPKSASPLAHHRPHEVVLLVLSLEKKMRNHKKTIISTKQYILEGNGVKISNRPPWSGTLCSLETSGKCNCRAAPENIIYYVIILLYTSRFCSSSAD